LAAGGAAKKFPASRETRIVGSGPKGPSALPALPALAAAIRVDQVRRPDGPPRVGQVDVADQDQKIVLSVHRRADDRDHQVGRVANRAPEFFPDQSKGLDARKIGALNPERPERLVRNDRTDQAPPIGRQPGRGVGERAARGRNEAAEMDVKLVLAADDAGIDDQRDLVARRRTAFAVAIIPRAAQLSAK
jgi:hypothetical protein